MFLTQENAIDLIQSSNCVITVDTTKRVCNCATRFDLVIGHHQAIHILYNT